MNLNFRLLFSRPGSGTWQPLDPPLEMTAALPLNDVSSLTVTYSRMQAVPLPLTDLYTGAYVKLELGLPGGAWSTPPGGIFCLMDDSRDDTDPTGAVSFTLPGVGSLLDDAKSIVADPVREDGSRQFTAPTPGIVLGTILKEAQARNTAKHLTWGFTATAASDGQAWADKTIISDYDWGQSALEILDQMVNLDRCDWQMRDFDLYLTNAGGIGTDRAKTANPVTVHLRREVTEAPVERRMSSMAGRFLIKGDGNLRTIVENPNAPAPYGVREKVVAMGGVSDEGTARALADAEIRRGSTPRTQATRSIDLAAAGFAPLIDYFPGDWILAAVDGQELEAARVYEIRLTAGGGQIRTADLVLNDRFLDDVIRRERQLKAAAGGMELNGGTQKAVTGVRRTLLVPAAPEHLTAYTSAYYDQDMRPRGRFILKWDEVTESVGVTDADILDWDTGGGGARLTIVVAPHPGDEILRLAGYIPVCTERGDTLVLIGCSRGEASRARPASMSKEQFGSIRETEQRKGWAALAGSKAGYVQMGLPDGNLAAYQAQITQEVQSWADKAESVEVYVCARSDEGGDKGAVAAAVTAAAPELVRYAYPPDMVTGFKYKPESPYKANKAMESYQFSIQSAPALWNLAKEQGWVTYLSTAPSGGTATRIDGKGRITVILARPGEETRRLGSYIANAHKRGDELRLVTIGSTQAQADAWEALTKNTRQQRFWVADANQALSTVRNLVGTQLDVEVYVAGDRGSDLASIALSSGAKTVRFSAPWGSAQGIRYEVPDGYLTALRSAWRAYYPEGKRGSSDRQIREDAENRRFVSWVIR